MRNFMMATAILAMGTALPSLSTAANIGAEAKVTTQSSLESRTAERTYAVRVRGDRNDSRDEVYDEALYEAAKKTRKKDYDWFRVVETDVEREVRRDEDRSGFETEWERVPYRDCGLLTCRTTYRTERRSSVTLDFDDREETRYSVELEFQVGWGPMPADGEVYDARHAQQKYR